VGVTLALATTTVGLALNNRGLTQQELALVRTLHADQGNFVHLNQTALNAFSNQGSPSARFTAAFEQGDEEFAHEFTAAEGGGAFVGNGERYTRIPRADLTGAGMWASHTPARATGPNAANCAACHNEGAEDGAGPAVDNVHRDPLHSGNIRQMIQRNTPHVLGLAGLQLLGEEMTAELQSIRQNARNAACGNAGFAQAQLTTKGVNFGTYRVSRTSGPQNPPCPFNDQSSTFEGISSDLVVKPFQWKGTVPFIRDFVRGAMHNELGVQGVEMSGENVDGDGDGVVNELVVGDISSLAVYMAAQARPTTKLEVNSLGLLTPALTNTEITQINRGRTGFGNVGCASCHSPSLTLNGRTFSEPSQNANFRDATFPAGQDPVQRGLSPANPVRFDITRDQPDNRVTIPNTGGDLLGGFRRSGNGAVVPLFGDLKRHRMGFDLAESIDEEGTGADSFMTENLWGVGSTGPYLHDGRATTLTEAILYHTGTAETDNNGRQQPNASRQAFLNLPQADQAALIAFLNNLILFRTD
jgi:cytochrome c peroxidase